MYSISSKVLNFVEFKSVIFEPLRKLYIKKSQTLCLVICQKSNKNYNYSAEMQVLTSSEGI